MAAAGQQTSREAGVPRGAAPASLPRGREGSEERVCRGRDGAVVDPVGVTVLRPGRCIKVCSPSLRFPILPFVIVTTVQPETKTQDFQDSSPLDIAFTVALRK
eukprot:gene9560-biopygen19740